MSKKVCMTMFMLSLLLSSYTPCIAASVESDSATIYASYSSGETTGIYTSSIQNGAAKVVTKEGFVISVKGDFPEGLSLVVMPILKSETDAMKWFEKCLMNYGTNVIPFDIYFIDSEDTRIPVNCEFTISISLPNDYNDPSAYYLSTDEKLTQMKSNVVNNTIDFTTNHDGYYVLAEKKTPNITPEKPDSPNTGEYSNTFMWLIIASISCSAMLVILKCRKQKRT